MNENPRRRSGLLGAGILAATAAVMLPAGRHMNIPAGTAMGRTQDGRYRPLPAYTHQYHPKRLRASSGHRRRARAKLLAWKGGKPGRVHRQGVS